MPREQKIGYTLLILIVGFAAAFCFRKPADEDLHALQLKSESEINRKIADDRVRPFLPEAIQAEQEAQNWDPVRKIPGWSNAPRVASDNLPAPIGQILPVDPVVENYQPETPQVPLPRDYPVIQEQVTAQVPVPVPAPHEVSPFEDGIVRAPSPVSEPSAHTIQPGETLSGIAYKYYRSASKAQELFEANRDVLSSPNNIRPGQTIKIPQLSQTASNQF